MATDKRRVTISLDDQTLALMRVLGISVNGGQLGRHCSSIVEKSIKKLAQERGHIPEDIPVFSTDPKTMAKELDKQIEEAQGIRRVLDRKMATISTISRELASC